MSGAPDASGPTLLAAEPQLFVADIGAACALFGRLGFMTAFEWGDPPFYAQVRRGGARLNLRHVDASPFLPGRRERDSLLAASITVDDVAALDREFRAAGVDFHQELARQPWGARDLVIRDPDGNLILFAGG